MLRVRLAGIKVLMYAGILESEKRRKQKVEFDVEYTEPENGFVDYSEVCATVRETALSKKWGLLEELLRAIEGNIRRKHEGIGELRVTARKRMPCGMRGVSSAEVEIASKR